MKNYRVILFKWDILNKCFVKEEFIKESFDIIGYIKDTYGDFIIKLDTIECIDDGADLL